MQDSHHNFPIFFIVISFLELWLGVIFVNVSINIFYFHSDFSI